MKFSITVAVACAALAAARPVNDNGKRQLDQLLSGLTGGAGGQQGANPLAGFLGGAGASAGDATGGNPLAGLLGGAGAGAGKIILTFKFILKLTTLQLLLVTLQSQAQAIRLPQRPAAVAIS